MFVVEWFPLGQDANNLQFVKWFLNTELHRRTNHQHRMTQRRFGEPSPIQPHHRRSRLLKTALHHLRPALQLRRHGIATRLSQSLRR